MGRFARSMALFKESYAVLRSNPQLALFPILTGVVSLFVMASFAVPVALFFMGHQHTSDRPEPWMYLVTFAYYFVSYFVVIYFNSALVACAYANLQGRQMSLREGIGEANKRLPSIVLWALIASTVGMILRWISERAGIIGQIVIAIVGMAWTLITYFVVPIMVIEGKGATKSIRESGAMLKGTWGERIIGGVGIGMVGGLLMLLCLIPIIGGIALLVSGMVAFGIALIALAVVWIIGISIIMSSVQGVFQTAVYIYGRTGQVPQGFTSEYVQMAFVPKKERKKSFG